MRDHSRKIRKNPNYQNVSYVMRS